MGDETWAFKSALEQAQAIAAKTISPRELVALYYERIARLDPDLNAFVLLTRELAESQATASEKRIARGACSMAFRSRSKKPPRSPAIATAWGRAPSRNRLPRSTASPSAGSRTRVA
jgi:hypothetical protein